MILVAGGELFVAELADAGPGEGEYGGQQQDEQQKFLHGIPTGLRARLVCERRVVDAVGGSQNSEDAIYSDRDVDP